MNSVPQYEEMKDSGIKWIGKVPTDWNIRRLYQIVTRVNNKNTELAEQNLLSLSYGKIKRKDINTKDGLLPASFDGYNIIEGGDIVLRLTDLQNDHTSLRVGHATEKGIITSAYITIRPINPAHSDYLYYLIHAFDLKKGFYGMGSGVRQGLNYDEVKELRVVMPSQEEQKAIVTYLDDQCAQIDSLVQEAKDTIEEYESLRQSMIAQTVTKGLDSNVSFKKVKFIWMGQIPYHWELKPFKHILTERNEKNKPVKSTERLSLSIDKGVTLYAEKTTNLDRLKEDFTAYKLAYKGDLVMNSMNMIVGASGVSDYFGCVSPVYYTYYDNTDDYVTAKYCEYLFRSRMLMRVLRSLGKGIYSIDRGDDRVNTCRLKVSRDDLRSLILPLPPIDEQIQITAYLDEKCAAIDEIIAEKESLITDLESYKKSLIYETVTGKRKVVQS